MAQNIVLDKWLPVRRTDGTFDWVSPVQVAPSAEGPQIEALNFPRPDFNAAVLEFLIGLFTVAMLPDDERAWRDAWDTPPDEAALAKALKPFVYALNLDAEGPRAFQDLGALEAKDEKEINAILIDAPGEKTEEQNADLFIKRGGVDALSPAMAAAALITLQTYAPSGGAGHRTSLRGGGPLTTLVVPKGAPSLWGRIWANVASREALENHDGWAMPLDPNTIFPWLSQTRESKGDRGTTPSDAHPLQSFFGLPRRIRLDFAPSGGATCGLGGPQSDRIVRTFRMRRYGVNYTGAWRHPLTPYRLEKKSGEKLPLHPNPGSLSYRHWLGLTGLGTLGKDAEAALIVALGKDRFQARQPLISASGFDMDNMKARAWVEQTMPLYAAAGKHADKVAALATAMIGRAETAANSLTFAIKVARHGKRKDATGKSGTVQYELRRDLKGDFSFIAEQFWRETESTFRALMDRAMNDPAFLQEPIFEEWGKALTVETLRIFDALVDFQQIGLLDYARPIVARKGLVFALRDKVSNEPKSPKTDLKAKRGRANG
ncbi:MAG TPA: type I-E CRISPR-associated protein Cse1/CasA [Alphaproteobacteria bacterium]|nr:type I-E CRISPR-associated protein Cse1/CasA [Alphaproteobacteria bacterium]